MHRCIKGHRDQRSEDGSELGECERQQEILQEDLSDVSEPFHFLLFANSKNKQDYKNLTEKVRRLLELTAKRPKSCAGCCS